MSGASVLGIKYRDGVMMMADTLGGPCSRIVPFGWLLTVASGSYGSLARFKSLRRMRKINDTTALGASGEYSDFQQIISMLEEQT